MVLSITFIICILLNASRCSEDIKLPPWLGIGTASSAYQVEGAWNIADKSDNIWDNMLHYKPDAIPDKSNGDVACDSYNLWQRDIEMLNELGVHFYRFSISWTRLLPNGFSNYISEDGKNYYNNLINKLLENDIEPIVTLYHWDLPQNLQDLGGWTNPLISDWFTDYVKVVFSLYADRVKTWVTINEPIVVCDAAYKTGAYAPGIIEKEIIPFVCNKNLLIAHAKAWRIYDEDYKSLYHGKLSICNHLVWTEPKSAGDEELTELSREFATGRYSHPIYSEEGGWPPALEAVMNDYGYKKGYKHPLLPPFTEEEKELIKGTYDYYGFNYYITRLVRKAEPGESISDFVVDGISEIEAVLEINPDWPETGLPGIFVAANSEGIRNQIAWLRQKYGNIEFAIMENGIASEGQLDDQARIQFIYDHLKQISLSTYEDGANITAYTYWSVMDSFEWNEGYRPKFGLYHVDFSSTNLTRTSRSSGYYFARITKDHIAYDPTNYK